MRGRIDWKYALGLTLDDPGFDASVLSEFRSRLVAGDAAERLLDRLLEQCQARGLLGARGRQRSDSTHVLAAIRAMNRLECVVETMRHTLNALAIVVRAWLRTHAEPVWLERYGPRADDGRLPKAEDKRTGYARLIGEDGFALLARIAAPNVPTWLRELPAVEMLRRIWLQQYDVNEDGGVTWRTAEQGTRFTGLPEFALSPRRALRAQAHDVVDRLQGSPDGDLR